MKSSFSDDEIQWPITQKNHIHLKITQTPNVSYKKILTYLKKFFSNIGFSHTEAKMPHI